MRLWLIAPTLRHFFGAGRPGVAPAPSPADRLVTSKETWHYIWARETDLHNTRVPSEDPEFIIPCEWSSFLRLQWQDRRKSSLLVTVIEDDNFKTYIQAKISCIILLLTFTHFCYHGYRIAHSEWRICRQFQGGQIKIYYSRLKIKDDMREVAECATVIPGARMQMEPWTIEGSVSSNSLRQVWSEDGLRDRTGLTG